MAVEFAESAFRHGYDEDEFYEVLLGRYVKLRSQRGLDGVYEILGQNLAGDCLHVIYREVAEGSLRVFHIARMTEAERRRFARLRR